MLMLGVALIPTGSTQCDTDDYACKDAVARSEKAKVIHITHFQMGNTLFLTK